jgi:hypothetical protein
MINPPDVRLLSVDVRWQILKVLPSRCTFCNCPLFLADVDLKADDHSITASIQAHGCQMCQRLYITRKQVRQLMREYGFSIEYFDK